MSGAGFLSPKPMPQVDFQERTMGAAFRGARGTDGQLEH
jgi:hypothetical protein